MSTGLERKKNHKSTSRLNYESEKPNRNEIGSRSGIKLILNKNYEFKVEEKEPVFKNSCLRGFIKDEIKKDRKSEFIIRKNNKVSFSDDKNSTNLFKSVLSSLRKDRK